MKKTFVLLVSALMILSVVSCKKTIKGKKADKSASGLYCYGGDKCKCKVTGDTFTYQCESTAHATLMWNDTIQGYTGNMSAQAIKVLYVDNKLLVHSDCNNSFTKCGEPATYVRCE